MTSLRCRACAAELTRTVVDLGSMPLANSYLPLVPADAASEPRYQLHVRICDVCLLVQVEAAVPAEAIFTDYAYFSSYSASWVEHARRYALDAIDKLELGSASMVVEIASNDGYLLRHFADKGIGVVGVEPARNVAEVARANGIPTETRFFGEEYARELLTRFNPPDLIVANNVLAHVPDLNDFVRGLAVSAKGSSVISIEVPHVLRMLERTEFDTIYHEHFSYFSLLALRNLLGAHDLEVFDVEELPTHGGSLRVWATSSGARGVTSEVDRVLTLERSRGLDDPKTYESFAVDVGHTIAEFREFLELVRREGRRLAAYGAAAKGNTFLNAIGATSRDIAYVVDRSPHKQGHFLPGSHLPILDPGHVITDQPDYLLILPWNLRTEIEGQMAEIREWGGRFVVAVPKIEVF